MSLVLCVIFRFAVMGTAEMGIGRDVDFAIAYNMPSFGPGDMTAHPSRGGRGEKSDARYGAESFKNPIHARDAERHLSMQG